MQLKNNSGNKVSALQLVDCEILDNGYSGLRCYHLLHIDFIKELTESHSSNI